MISKCVWICRTDIEYFLDFFVCCFLGFFFALSWSFLKTRSLTTLGINSKDYCTDNEFPSVLISWGSAPPSCGFLSSYLSCGDQISLSSLPDLRVEDSPKAHCIYHLPSPALRANQTNCWTVYCVTYAKTTSSRFPLSETTRSNQCVCSLVAFCVCVCVCKREIR